MWLRRSPSARALMGTPWSHGDNESTNGEFPVLLVGFYVSETRLFHPDIQVKTSGWDPSVEILINPRLSEGEYIQRQKLHQGLMRVPLQHFASSLLTVRELALEQ